MRFRRMWMVAWLGCVAQIANAQADFDVRLGAGKDDAIALQRLVDAAPRLDVSTSKRERLAAATASLQRERDGVVLATSHETGLPELIGPARGKRTLGRVGDLRGEAAARAFVERYAPLYGIEARDVAMLRTEADYLNPGGNLAWVRLVQEIDGLPVFRSEITIALTPEGEIVRSTGQFAGALAFDPGTKHAAMGAHRAHAFAAKGLRDGAVPDDVGIMALSDDGRRATLRSPRTGIESGAELMLFPLGDGRAVLAWSVTLSGPAQSWQALVDANDGTLLFRRSLTAGATHSYLVYPSDSPAPLSPGPDSPLSGTQGARVAATTVTLDNQLQGVTNDPWLPAGATAVSGNNVAAGLELNADNVLDLPLLGPSAPGAFLYDSNPPPGLPAPGDAPNTSASRNAAIVNAFYWANRFHDLAYLLGFNEQARNFQVDNYGRGGVGNDPVQVEVQDGSGTNNANSSWPADGTRGRVQWYVWTGPTPDRDGAFDAEVMLHEISHGMIERLHNNSAGLNGNMPRALVEGWADYYSLSLLSEPSDPVGGIYAVGSYVTREISSGFLGNYYYGIRRFPKAILSSRGGPMNLPHDPQTFADIDPSKIDLTDGAFPRGPVGQSTTSTHGDGEIWSGMLWEARGRLIAKHGASVGNQRMLQYVTDGMKLDPVNPNFLAARDSILAAVCASFGGEDEREVWEGFAARGMGSAAEINSTSPVRVTESFDNPTDHIDLQVVGWSNATCPVADGRHPIPGETVNLRVRARNLSCGAAFQNLTLSAGSAAVNVGSLLPGQTVERDVPFVIPAGASCGFSTTATVQAQAGSVDGQITYALEVGENSVNSTIFGNATAIALPAGAPGASQGAAAPYPSSISVSGVATAATDLRVVLRGLTHTFPGDLDLLLVSPAGHRMIVLSDAVGGNPATNVQLSLRDDADAEVPATGALPSNGTFRPTNHDNSDSFFAPAPAGPYLSPAPVGAQTLAGLAQLQGDPNGTWQLYTVDDASGDTGSMSQGWLLEVINRVPQDCLPCNLVVFSDSFED